MVVAAWGDAVPTGLGSADVAWRLVVGALTAGLALWAGPYPLIAAALVGVLFGGVPVGIVAGAVTVAATVLVTVRRWYPVAGAVFGAAVGGLALHLPTAGHSVRQVLPAGLMLGVVWIAGVIQLPPRWRRQVFRRAGLVLLFGGILSAAAAIGALKATQAIGDGVDASDRAVASLREADGPGARAGFDEAGRSLRRARSNLDAWWALPGRAIPVVGSHLIAARSGVVAGMRIADAGGDLSAQLDLDLRIEGGQLPLERIIALAGPLERARTVLGTAVARLEAARSPWVVGPLDRKLVSAIDEAKRAEADTAGASRAVRLAPAMLGADGPRRYLVLIQTPSEARGSGGLIGNYAEIVAEQGRLTLTRLGRQGELNVGGLPADQRRIDAPADWLARYTRFGPTEVWQNANLSPDFPATAQATASLYPQSSGTAVDGVIGIDPSGLAALLAVTGPVRVDGWPVPLDAANTRQILLFEEYVRFPDPVRHDFLGDAAQAIFDHLTNSTLPSPGALTRRLSQAVDGRNLQLYSVRPDEQRSLRDLGLDGGVPPVAGDSLGVVVQNAGGNKIDWFLEEDLDYRVSLDPSDGALSATLKVRLRNTAPAGGLPPIIIGSTATPPLPSGTNRLYLSVYTPWGLAGAEIDGRAVGMQSELELGRRAYSSYVDVAPGGTTELTLKLEGVLPASPAYHLDVFHQPLVNPASLQASLELTPGWRFVARQPTNKELQLDTPTKLTGNRELTVELGFG